MKLKYETTLIWGIDHNLNPKIVAKDETLFTHKSNNERIWVIGGIETMDKKLRITAIKSMIQKQLKTLLTIILWKERILPIIDGQDIISLAIIFIYSWRPSTWRGDFGCTFNFTYRKFMGKFKKIYLYGVIPKKIYFIFEI